MSTSYLKWYLAQHQNCKPTVILSTENKLWHVRTKSQGSVSLYNLARFGEWRGMGITKTKQQSFSL